MSVLPPGVSPRIALVKQVVYPDLYVAPAGTSDPLTLLLSSAGRVGPLGLHTRCGADFYIVEEDPAPECATWRLVQPRYADRLPLLRHKLLNELPGEEFKQPGSPHPNGRFAVAPESVDWSRYDIVISLNVALPTRLVRQHPGTLFCYMIGEANLHMTSVRFGYDVSLDQETLGGLRRRMGVVNFPYTFLGGDCLERLLAVHLGRPSARSGIYVEINSCPERPVREVPAELLPLADLGHPFRLHRQHIAENLTAVFDSKYFVKSGGRTIRGNSVIEAISCGALVLMDPDRVHHGNLLPPETHARSVQELHQRIAWLEKDPEAYERLRALQRARVEACCFENPRNSLLAGLQHKRRLRGRPLARFAHRSSLLAEDLAEQGWRLLKKWGGKLQRATRG